MAEYDFSQSPFNFNLEGQVNPWDIPATNYGSDAPRGVMPDNTPTGYSFSGSDAPVGQIPSGYNFDSQDNYRSGQAPEQPSWWDRNSSGQLGVDNAFRLGGIGLAGLGMAGNIAAGKRQEHAADDAINYLNSQRDPNSSFYQTELNRMIKDPNGHLTDVVTQNRINATRDAIMRQNAAAGRPGQLTADQMRAMQEASQGAYQQRIKTLQDLLAGDRQLTAATADIMSKRKTFEPLQAVAPFLQNMFKTGEDYAISQGYASDPRFRRSADAIGLDEKQAEQYNRLVRK